MPGHRDPSVLPNKPPLAALGLAVIPSTSKDYSPNLLVIDPLTESNQKYKGKTRKAIQQKGNVKVAHIVKKYTIV